MAEYAVVNDYNVAVVPKGVSDVQAAMIEPAAVAVYAVDRGGVTSGSTVLVSGLGPIGALTLLAVRAAGAAVIFVSEPNAYRRNLAKQLVPDAICSIRPRTMWRPSSATIPRKASVSMSPSNASDWNRA